MKVCPLTRISRNLPQCSPYQGCLLHGKNIPVPPWPNRTQCHFGRQHPSGIFGVMISLECESLASLIDFEASYTAHYCQALFIYDWVLSFC